MQYKSNKESSYFRKKGEICRIIFVFQKKGEKKDMVNKNTIIHVAYFFPILPIEPHLVLKHISFINTPPNPIFLLVTRVNIRDFTVCKVHRDILNIYLKSIGILVWSEGCTVITETIVLGSSCSTFKVHLFAKDDLTKIIWSKCLIW